MHRKLFAAIFLSAFVLTAPALAVGGGDDDALGADRVGVDLGERVPTQLGCRGQHVGGR